MPKYPQTFNLDDHQIAWLRDRAFAEERSPSAVLRDVIDAQRTQRATLDPISLLVDVIGLLCYAMDRQPTRHGMSRKAAAGSPGTQGALCQEPAVIAIQDRGEWIALCPSHRPLWSSRDSYEIGAEVQRRIERLRLTDHQLWPRRREHSA